MPRNTRKPAETPDTEQATETPAQTEQATETPDTEQATETPAQTEQATETPAQTEQATETPATKPALRDWVRLIGSVLADWIGFSVRRPRKGLPAVALGFGLGLLSCAGLLALFPPLNLNAFLWGGIVAPFGFLCIVWALWPQE